MHCDEAANASCAQTGLEYIDAFYNEARVNALIRELVQPALNRFRAKAKLKSACDVLQFAPAPQLAERTIASNAEGRERRIVFK
jgi:predicted secreted protein